MGQIYVSNAKAQEWQPLAFVFSKNYTLREKCPITGFFSGPYFPVFGLNTEIYEANFRE